MPAGSSAPTRTTEWVVIRWPAADDIDAPPSVLYSRFFDTQDEANAYTESVPAHYKTGVLTIRQYSQIRKADHDF